VKKIILGSPITTILIAIMLISLAAASPQQIWEGARAAQIVPATTIFTATASTGSPSYSFATQTTATLSTSNTSSSSSSSSHLTSTTSVSLTGTSSENNGVSTQWPSWIWLVLGFAILFIILVAWRRRKKAKDVSQRRHAHYERKQEPHSSPLKVSPAKSDRGPRNLQEWTDIVAKETNTD
jgi:hypothetical protein